MDLGERDRQLPDDSADDPCPPTSNQQTSFVTITVTHNVPIFFPFVPGNGNLSSSTQYRMEPVSAP